MNVGGQKGERIHIAKGKDRRFRTKIRIHMWKEEGLPWRAIVKTA